MGYQIEFNWVLKLSGQEVETLLACWQLGNVFEFEKREERLYPMRAPLDVVDDGWAVRGRGEIIELWIGDYRTRGKIRQVQPITDYGHQAKFPLATIGGEAAPSALPG